MIKITKKKFNAYREIQFSGVTNMWATDVVADLSGLERYECLDIIKKYDLYEKRYGKFKNSP